MYEQQKHQLRQLEDRNFELEQKFSDVTRMNLESQKIERELRDELASKYKTHNFVAVLFVNNRVFFVQLSK